MSLNWNLTRIENYEEKCFIPTGKDGNGRRQLNPVTHILIWYTMGIDMGEITEKNAEEFLLRVKMHDAVFGHLGYDGEGNDYNVTLKDVLDHVGLKTNVFGNPKNFFDKKLLRKLREDAQAAVRKEKSQPAIAATSEV